MPLHVISWNVASLKRCHKYICQNHGSLARFFELHQADIVCLQETKCHTTALSCRKDAQELGMFTEGWDAFIAPCRLNK